MAKKDSSSGAQTEIVELIEIRPAGAFGKPDRLRKEKKVVRKARKQREMKVALGLLCETCGGITGKSYGVPTLCEKCTVELEKSKEVKQ